MLVRITSSYFCVGIVFEGIYGKGDRVVKTAPILKYMMGWSMDDVIKYMRKKGWKGELLEPFSR